MIINISGSGIDNLKFRVYSATSLPASGKENDVVIITSTPISSWEAGCVDNPAWSMAAGFVYLTCAASDASQPNLLRKNALYLELTRCLQYENGTWLSKDAYQYRNGAWVQFSSVNVIPVFTYTGDYEIVNDADEPITTSQDNWKIRFLTSGTLTFQTLNGAENGIDAFLVGGGGAGGASCRVNAENPLWGGGGGGGGYTNTQKAVSVTKGTAYAITVGAGGTGVSGANGNDGGSSSAFGISANGGKGGYAGTTQPNGRNGGAGGSGGGRGGKKSLDSGAYQAPGSGGSDGSDSSCGTGKGQGTTTREFGESNGRLYSGGGAGGESSAGGSASGGAGGGGNQDTAGETNTGGGGGNSKPGGSGIVVIRNKR